MQQTNGWSRGVFVIAMAALWSCSSGTTYGVRPAEESEGSVGLKLVPVSGVTLDSVHYVVTNGASPAVTLSEGDLPTPGSASSFSFAVPLPVGSGYNISVSAASSETGDDITCGGSFGPFSVAPNQSTPFTLSLTCKDNTNGQIFGGVDVQTDACPRLAFDYVAAVRSAAFVGDAIPVIAKAHDLDGKAVSYSWRASPPFHGAFTPTTGSTSVFSCQSRGFGVSLTVQASNGECSKQLSTTVSCTEGECGDGIVEPGETCDTATVCAPGQLNCIPGNQCSFNCVFTCGNGVVEPPAETCDPPNTASCDSSCHIHIDECNDGLLGPTEACDPSAHPSFHPTAPTCASCSSTCQLVADICGDGVVGACEQCDDMGASPSCSADCQLKVSTPACVDCENAGTCSESVDNCLGPNGAFNAQQRSQCYSVMKCIEASNCFDGTGTLAKCYCGTLSTAQCGGAPLDLTAPGAPNGPCAASIQLGMPNVTTNLAVLEGLTATARPAGAAIERLRCQKAADDAACFDVCGFTPGGPEFP